MKITDFHWSLNGISILPTFLSLQFSVKGTILLFLLLLSLEVTAKRHVMSSQKREICVISSKVIRDYRREICVISPS